MLLEHHILLWIINIIVVGSGAVIFFFFQRTVSKIESRIENIESKSDAHRNELKVEFNRALEAIKQKSESDAHALKTSVDKLLQTVNSINKEWQIANAVAVERSAQQASHIVVLFEKYDNLNKAITDVASEINKINLVLGNHIAKSEKI